jgi:crotonobetainyl-CoA:carnitine CoA-transferase CaiB-like acyl-CoA transferase
MLPKGIFSSVRIVELAQFVFVPAASVFFADQGAEVIKVETTGSGDPYRSLRVGDGRELKSANLAMEQNNRGKKSIALDLKSEAGREALLALIRTADVFLTSLRPKAIRALRLEVADLRAVNPKIIYVRGNGLGFRGDEADKPGFDASCFWARGGMAYVMSPPGGPLTPPRPAFGDHSGAANLAFGLAGALYHRAVSGEPSVVETSLLSTALWMLSADITYSQSPDYRVHHPDPYRFPLMSAYRTRDDRLIQLMLLDPQPHWPGLCRVLGADAWSGDLRFVDNAARTRNGKILNGLISEKIAAHDWAHWQPIFEAWDAPWELIRSVADLWDDPQVIANDMTFKMTTPSGGEVGLVACPVSFDGKPYAQKVGRAPLLGEHTDAVLAGAGYSPEAIAALKRSGAAQ